MLIDWFTVGAQVINFLILVWLLKRFLYHPILDAIDAREKGIAVKLADAQAKETEATREREAFQRKNADFDAARAALLRDATAAAATERQRLLDAAREAATALGAKRQERLLRDAQTLQQEIGRRMQQEVFALARKVLADLAGAPLEAQMVSVFTERLAALGGDDKDTLQRALQAGAQPLVVRTGFVLPAVAQVSVEAAVRTLLGAGTTIRFDIAPDLVSGIELSTDGQKVAWSVTGYLNALESSMGEWLKAGAEQAGAAGKDVADVR